MKLLDSERVGHRLESWYQDDGKIIHHTVEDAEPIIEANKRAFNDAPERFGKGDFHKVASVPLTMVEDLCRIHKISFRELMNAKSDHAQLIWNRFLNERALRHFRTRPGRVDVRK